MPEYVAPFPSDESLRLTLIASSENGSITLPRSQPQEIGERTLNGASVVVYLYVVLIECRTSAKQSTV